MGIGELELYGLLGARITALLWIDALKGIGDEPFSGAGSYIRVIRPLSLISTHTLYLQIDIMRCGPGVQNKLGVGGFHIYVVVAGSD